MNTSTSIAAIAPALAKAQGEIPTVNFDSTNPHFRSKYASYAAIVQASRDALSNNGLSILHSITEVAEKMTLETTLLHSSGEWILSTTPLILSKEDMQGVGSAVTYGKRQAVTSLLKIAADEDDDGNHNADQNKSSHSPPADRTRSNVTIGTKSVDLKDPWEFVIQFGKKYMGKKVKDIPYEDLKSYLEWLDSSMAKKGQGRSPEVEQLRLVFNLCYRGQETGESDVPFSDAPSGPITGGPA